MQIVVRGSWNGPKRLRLIGSAKQLLPKLIGDDLIAVAVDNQQRRVRILDNSNAVVAPHQQRTDPRHDPSRDSLHRRERRLENQAPASPLCRQARCYRRPDRLAVDDDLLWRVSLGGKPVIRRFRILIKAALGWL